MKVFNFQKTSYGILSIAFLLLIATSCKKEEVVEHQYPDELTVHNCEEFVDAPQEVIDELIQKELAALAVDNPHTVDLPDNQYTHQCPNGRLLTGSLVAYDGTWRNLGNVKVRRANYSTFTTSTTDPLNYRLRVLGNNSERFYFDVNTPLLNGVTALDKLLILRHVNGNQPFTTFLQLCSGDVDRNDVIDQDDADLVGEAVLGNIDNFGYGTGVVVVDKNFYERRKNEWLSGDPFINPLGTIVEGPDFIAVKQGDVNATFNF